MDFLVEIDHVKPRATPTPEAGRAFIERIILPTLARAEALRAEKKIIAGGPVVGRIALRFIIEAASPQEVDRVVSSLPLWSLSEARVTPLIAFTDRRDHVRAILATLKHNELHKPTNP
jgi:muconolactone delta-isomerase